METVHSDSNFSYFNSITVDNSGNIYAAGDIFGGTYDFGNEVTLISPREGQNFVLVKYNSLGKAQWAQTNSSSSYYTFFSSVSVDNSANIYAVGDTGGGETVLVKYNSAGATQWVQTVSSTSWESYLYSICVDTTGNIYAAGYGYDGTYNFGNGVLATCSYKGANMLLIKYNSLGEAQWAQTISSAPSYSHFRSVSVDNSGYIYAAGDIGTGTFDFGNSVSIISNSFNNYGSTILVKYDSSGVAQWAETTSYCPNHSLLRSLIIDSSGNIFVVGQIAEGTYIFNNSISATGFSGASAILVKYNPSGIAQWAEVAYSNSVSSIFFSVSVNNSGNIYAAGEIWGVGGISYRSNNILVKYNNK
jgi:hypothetical protein